MRSLSIKSILIIPLFIWNVSNAQIGNLIKNAARHAVNKTIDEQFEKKKEQKQEQDKANDAYMQKKMLGMLGFADVKYDMNYSYTSSLTMDVKTFSSGDARGETMRYTSYFDKGSKNFAMEFQNVEAGTSEKVNSLLIFDFKNGAMLILSDNDGEKSGMALQMTLDSLDIYGNSEPEDYYTEEDLTAYNVYYKPTGKSKNIAGYACKEYVYDHPEGKIALWATKDFKLDYSNAFNQMGGGFMMATTGLGGGILGAIMEMNISDLENKEQTSLSVKEVNMNASKRINLVGYSILGIGE